MEKPRKETQKNIWSSLNPQEVYVAKILSQCLNPITIETISKYTQTPTSVVGDTLKKLGIKPSFIEDDKECYEANDKLKSDIKSNLKIDPEEEKVLSGRIAEVLWNGLFGD
jgi:hypothetical protein